MSITETGAMSDARNTVLTGIAEAHPCRITANVVGYESKRGATNGVTDQLELE